MKIEVFFESGNYAEKVAEFSEDSIYTACLPELEKIANTRNMIVTESVEE
jgi:hypothetical protein